jgi:hypothetical protein
MKVHVCLSLSSFFKFWGFAVHLAKLLPQNHQPKNVYTALCICIYCIYVSFPGHVDAAMKTALHLREYEDVLETEDIYCILALASCANRAFGTCSKAFIRLESLEKVTNTAIDISDI